MATTEVEDTTPFEPTAVGSDVQGPDSPPFVSLCVISGDEGVDGLDRLFQSVLNRASGPMFDEVSVYWNGSPDKKPECLKRPVWETVHGFKVPFVVSEGPWRDDFSWARQISFEQAHGIWRGYLDSVPGETPVPVRHAGSPYFEYVEIRDLLPPSICEEIDSGQRNLKFYERVPYEILTHNGWAHVRGIKAHRVTKPVYRITDSHGTVRVTEDHSLFAGGREIAGKDVAVGTVLDHADRTVAFGPQVTSLTEDLAEAWGFFAAEGHCQVAVTDQPRSNANRYTWDVANTDRELLDHFKSIFEAHHTRPFYYVEDTTKPEHKSVFRLWATDPKDVAVLYRDRFYTNAGRKKIPREILNGTTSIMAAFLRGYEAGDGHVARVDVEGKPLQLLTTDSPVLAAGLHYLYRHVGRPLCAIRPRSDKPHIVNLAELAGSWSRSKLSSADVESMKAMRADGSTYAAIGKAFGVSLGHARGVILDLADRLHTSDMERDGQDRRGGPGVKHIAAELAFEGVVYDVNTEHGTFVGGVGDFILHNSDDIIPTPEAPAIDESLKLVGWARADETINQPTLRDLLKDLSPSINVVQSPYFYTEIEGRPAVVNPRRRIFRWDSGWHWGNPVHEDCFPVRGNVPKVIITPGLVVQHRPLRPSSARVARNAQILFDLERRVGGPDKLDHRSLYGIACFYFDQRSDELAIEYYERAMRAFPPPPGPDLFLYRTMSAQASCRLGRLDTALDHAMHAVLAQPDRPAGYLELARAYFLAGNFSEAVRWFREGFARKDAPSDGLQHPMAIGGQLRAMGAHALLSVGAVDEALEWAKLAAAVDPGAFPEHTLKLAQDVKARGDAERAFTTLAEFLESRGEIQQLRALSDALPAALDGSGPAFAVAAKLAGERALDAGPPPDPWPIPNTARANLGLAEDHPVVGDPLVRALDPTSVLAAAEAEATARGADVHVVVPDGSRLLTDHIQGARTVFTPERLHRVLSARGQVTTLRSIPPESFEGTPTRFHLAASYVPGPRPSPKGVAIWCPHFAQSWGPYEPERSGTGGSEEAVLYLAKALARRGYEPTVYAPLPPNDVPLRVENGVVWRHLQALDPDRPFDHFVFHRAPAMAAACPWASKHLWTWHHDHFYSEEYWSPRLAAATRHLYVSRWQRHTLEDLIGMPTSGRTIWNGVPPDQFERLEQQLTSRRSDVSLRNPKAVAYASMPTRGLDRLLDLWPMVLESVPDATLVIYYGTHTIRQLWRGPQYNVAGKLQDMERKIADLMKAGAKVISRGRVGQDMLTEEFLQLGVMAYPTAFSEVYMIAGARALAAGMRLVCTDSACLPETMVDQTYMVRQTVSDGEWLGGGRERFALRLIQAITEPEDAYDRVAVAARAREVCSWDHVARRVADSFESAERGDTSFFESDVGTVARTIPGGPADMRIPRTPQDLESVRVESMAAF